MLLARSTCVIIIHFIIRVYLTHFEPFFKKYQKKPNPRINSLNNLLHHEREEGWKGGDVFVDSHMLLQWP